MKNKAFLWLQALVLKWGGVGMSTVGFVAAMEQIGRADQSVAAAWQAHVTIGSLPLYLFGNDAQRERWLRPWRIFCRRIG